MKSTRVFSLFFIVAFLVVLVGCSSSEEYSVPPSGGVSPEEIKGERREILEELGVWDRVQQNVDLVYWKDGIIGTKEDEWGLSSPVLGLAYECGEGLNCIDIVENPDVLYEVGRSNSYRNWEIELEIAVIIYHEMRHFEIGLSEGDKKKEDEAHKIIRPEEADLRRKYVEIHGLRLVPGIDIWVSKERFERKKGYGPIAYRDEDYRYVVKAQSGREFADLSLNNTLLFFDYEVEGERTFEGKRYVVLTDPLACDGYHLTLENLLSGNKANFDFIFDPYEKDENKYVFNLFLENY